MSHTIVQAGSEDSELLAQLIRDAFADVALRFGLTPQNCPTHPSNCTSDWIHHALSHGRRYFLLREAEDIPVGCVALCTKEARVGTLERLAVLPPYRGRGYGDALVRHVVEEARRAGLLRLELGMIADDLELLHWYTRRGFAETSRQHFPHLPFVALMMQLPLT